MKIKPISLYLLVSLLFVMTASGCLHKPRTFYFGDYSEAEALYNRGEYEKAIQKYQSYIDQNPEGHLAVISRYYIAKSHLALGRPEPAKEIFQTIVRDHPNLVWANFSETQLKDLAAASSSPEAQ